MFNLWKVEKALQSTADKFGNSHAKHLPHEGSVGGLKLILFTYEATGFYILMDFHFPEKNFRRNLFLPFSKLFEQKWKNVLSFMKGLLKLLQLDVRNLFENNY